MEKEKVPKVLEIIRTAAADCNAQDNTMARDELLRASAMTRGLYEALQVAITFADRRQAHGSEMPTLGQWRSFERLARAAIAKASPTDAGVAG